MIKDYFHEVLPWCHDDDCSYHPSYRNYLNGYDYMQSHNSQKINFWYITGDDDQSSIGLRNFNVLATRLTQSMALHENGKELPIQLIWLKIHGSTNSCQLVTTSLP